MKLIICISLTLLYLQIIDLKILPKATNNQEKNNEKNKKHEKLLKLLEWIKKFKGTEIKKIEVKYLFDNNRYVVAKEKIEVI